MGNNHKLRIIYMGTPEFAVLPLKRLVDEGVNIVAVVTNPDKPAGRGQQIQESPVKQFAVEHNIPVLQPEKFKNEQFLADLAAYKADLQLVVAFKMLPEIVWNMPRLGTVNLHTSLLPHYRGAAPINWAIMNGEKESGVSTFLLQHEIDTGNIILQRSTPITDEMNAGELHDQLMQLGADLLLETVEQIENGDYVLKSQSDLLNGEKAKHAPKIFKEDMRIHWDWSLEHLYNHVRGLSPYPAAWFELKDRTNDKVISAKLFKAERESVSHHYPIGYLESDGKSYIKVYVHDGYLSLKEIQLAGKKRMKVDELLRGFKINNYELV